MTVLGGDIVHALQHLHAEKNPQLFQADLRFSFHLKWVVEFVMRIFRSPKSKQAPEQQRIRAELQTLLVSAKEAGLRLEGQGKRI